MAAATDGPEDSGASNSSSSPASDSKRPSQDSKPKLKPNFRYAFFIQTQISLLITASDPKTFVTLIAGKGSEEVEFVVHKEFVCHHCAVLEAAFKSNFIEGRTQTYRFPEVNGPVIQKLVQWFYSQDINIQSLEEEVYQNLETRALIQLWILADKLLLRSLQNLILRKLDLMRARFGMLPTLTYRYAYENTSKGSLLRLFLVHRAAGMSRSYIDSHPQRFPREMLVEMVVAMGNEHNFGDDHFGRESNWSQYEVKDGPKSV
ncbi:hypothetical protein VTL71DRAFT_12100 [Oculimacula yallundae]|uniref:BTB domain-containing protein n=1 Tax=Oculimacula yallundae TaxID=86028 RepID=A0ABR4CSL0_9HELO